MTGLLAFGPAGCGGILSRSGAATVTNVTCDSLLVQYSDGKSCWKRLDPGNARNYAKLAQKNLLKPAKFVETKSGSTLTFPDGETLVYFDPH